MKKHALFLFALIIAIGLSIVFILTTVDSDKKETAFAKATKDRIEQRIANEEGMILYFGRDTCMACREFQPILNEAIQKTNNESVYYLDMDNLQNKEIADKYGVDRTPTLLVFSKDDIEKYEGVKNLDTTIDILSE